MIEPKVIIKESTFKQQVKPTTIERMLWPRQIVSYMLKDGMRVVRHRGMNNASYH